MSNKDIPVSKKVEVGQFYQQENSSDIYCITYIDIIGRKVTISRVVTENQYEQGIVICLDNFVENRFKQTKGK